jgi:ferritin-like metal-binding protein YciE
MKSEMKQSSNGKSPEPNPAQQNDSSPAKAKGLQDLFEAELKDIYWAEKALTRAIPKMIKNASSPELINALHDHLKATKQQVMRCEEVFDSLGMKAEAQKCEAMDGLIKEADEIMESTDAGSVRDAGIISAAQKVEHYEIASYGTLCAFAKLLGHEVAASLLQETLIEEKEADTVLTEIAQSTINQEAMTAQEENK